MPLEPGDKVFYSHNCAGGSDYDEPARRAICALGLVPLIYGGVDLSMRRSNFDHAIRDSFYESRVIVLLFGKGERWRSLEDHWTLPELKHTSKFGITFLVYRTPQVELTEITNVDLPFYPGLVPHVNDFERILKRDLQVLMES